MDNQQFRLERLSDYSKQSILAEVRRVQELVGKKNITQAEFLKHSRVGANAVRRKLGTWPEVLRKTGLELGQDDYGNLPHNSRGVGARGLTNEQILQEIRQLSDKIDKGFLTYTDMKDELSISYDGLRKRFGSARKAIEAAGVNTSSAGKRYTDEQCFENLLSVWTHAGRQPRVKDMNHAPSEVGAKAYLHRYGTWMKALEAFVERTNAETSELSEIEIADVKAKAATDKPLRSSCTAVKPEDVRDIRLGQRFRVLRRDSFKCVLCGNSPAVDPACVLHVDHILPFSRGGRTTDENLRSTCEKCNLGRGNRYLDRCLTVLFCQKIYLAKAGKAVCSFPEC